MSKTISWVITKEALLAMIADQMPLDPKAVKVGVLYEGPQDNTPELEALVFSQEVHS